MEIDKQTKTLLRKIYYNPKLKGGLRGIQNLYLAAKELKPNIKFRTVKEWLRWLCITVTVTGDDYYDYQI